MDDTESIRLKRRFLIGFTPICLVVAGYCMLAGLAAGGWRRNREGEPSYSPPTHYSWQFYESLRWSVFAIGITGAIAAFAWGHRRVGTAFALCALLFNPLVRVHLDKDVWQAIDVIAFWVLMSCPFYVWPKKD